MHKIVEESTICRRAVTICDRCGKEGKRYKSCIICKRDVCDHCAVMFEFENDLAFPTFLGDYPSYICKKCWDDGETIRNQIMKIRTKAIDDETVLIKNWEDLGKNDIL